MTVEPEPSILDLLLNRPPRTATVTLPRDPNEADGPKWVIRLAAVGSDRYEQLWDEHSTDGKIDASKWTPAAFIEACRSIVDTETSTEVHLAPAQVPGFIAGLPVSDRTLIGQEIIRLDTEGTARVVNGDA